METRKRTLGAEHPDTLMSMNDLAYTWKSQDRNEEAIDLMKQAKGLLRERLGTDHPLTMSCVQTLYEWQRLGRAHVQYLEVS